MVPAAGGSINHKTPHSGHREGFAYSEPILAHRNRRTDRDKQSQVYTINVP